MQPTTTIAAFAGRRLRHDELRRTTHIARCAAGGLVLVFLLAFVRTAGQIDAPGKALLSVVIWVNVIAVLLTALTFFTSVLSEERDTGTLSLLKLASDRDGSVLAGLVLPRLVYALALLAVQIPFALLSVTLGGVTARQVFGCYLTLCLSTVLLSAVVTCAATLTRTMGAVVQLLIAYLFSLFLTSFVVSVFIGNPSSEIYSAVFAAIPTGQVLLWLENVDRPFIDAFFWSVLIQTALAVFVAWIVFPTSELEGGEQGEGIATRFRQWMARRRKFAPTNFTKGPHAWKDFNLVAGGHAGWILRAALYLAVATLAGLVGWWNWMLSNGRAFDIGGLQAAAGLFGATLTTVTCYVLPVECAWLAARRVRIELDDSNWELLELLPTSRQFILSGKGSGTLQGLLPGVVLAFVGLLVAGSAAGVEEAVMTLIFGGVFGGTMMCAVLVCVWFISSHLALKMNAGPAAGLTILIAIGIPVVLVLPMMILGGFGFLVTLCAIPVGFGYLVAAITTFSDKFYKRALQGSDETQSG